MAVRPRDFEGATSRVLRAPRRFDLLGVRGPDAARGRFEVRVRPRGGQWSPWVPLAVHGDHAPDTGSGERASDPVWAGGCDELQLRFSGRLRGALRVHFVAVRRRAGKRCARAARPRPAAGRAAAGHAAADHPARRVGRRLGAAALGARATAWCRWASSTTRSPPTTTRPSTRPSIVLGIAKYHRDTNGWNDIGYNFLVDQYGQVFEGRAGGDRPGGHRRPGAGLQLAVHRRRGARHLQRRAESPRPRWRRSPSCWAGSCRCTACRCEGGLTIVSGGGRPEPLPVGDAGGDAAHLRAPRRRRDRVPGQRPLRPAPRAAPARRGAGGADRGARRGEPAAVGRGDQLRSRAVFTGTVIRPDASAGAGEAVALQKRGTGGTWVTVARTNGPGRRLVGRARALAARRRRARGLRGRDVQGDRGAGQPAP